MSEKYVIAEPNPEALPRRFSFEESIAMAVVSSTQHLDVTSDDQIDIAQAVLDAVRLRFAEVLGEADE